MSNTGGVSGERIRSFIKRYERLQEEKKAISEDMKEVMAEAKSTGFDVKVLKHIIKKRTWEKNDLDEFMALIDLYEHAIGFDKTPLGQAAVKLASVNNNLVKKGIKVSIVGNDIAAAVEKAVEESVPNIEKSKDDIEYDKALELVTSCNKVSCAFLQRQMHIGYNKAATIIERLENNGIISLPALSNGKREILIKQAAE